MNIIRNVLEDIGGFYSDSNDSDTSNSGSEEEAPEIPIYGKSKKGKEILSCRGNEFWWCKNYKTKSYWECAKVDETQVYVILAERDGYVFPVLYALLPDKSQETYEKLLRMICNVWPAFYPSSISVDYEMAVINAVEVVFGESEIWGCFFHLVQNLKKRLAKEHLKGRYDTDADFAITCRMITAMAFIKLEDIMDAFEKLCDELPIELDGVVEWFQKGYIGSVDRRGNFTPPMFAYSLWNLYERTLNGGHRTNNYAEAANHRIQTELDVCHPGLWTFITHLKTVQQGRDQKFLQWMLGKRPKGKRLKYQKADARILTIVQGYQGRDAAEYLRGIAHNFIMED